MKTFNDWLNEAIPAAPAGMDQGQWNHTYKSSNVETALQHAIETATDHVRQHLQKIAEVEVYPRLYDVMAKANPEQVQQWAVSLLLQKIKQGI